ncbi:MAG: helix-turn-helix transcriptional regulator [Acidobacteria bacterium]|nr:helix-turn-helix transcriptional regulator [Acidobacteriota bacterium]
MKTSPYVGEFEYSVLLAVLHVDGEGDGEAYAVPIRALLEERTSRPVARGALYTALERLEAKGCLRSRMGDPTAERGGKARRYFTVTPLGVRAIKAMHASLSNLSRGLEAVLEQP